MAANKNEMVLAGATRTYYYRRCKRIRWSVEYILDEVLFEILLRLPAQDIYFGARLVCREWYNITRTKNFIRKHIEHASYGLLYMDTSGDFVFISAREDDGGGIINTYKINYKVHFSRRETWACWDGLMLECDPISGKIIYYVENLLTHQVVRLPQCPYFIPFFALCAIGYDATSMTYKVVATFQQLEPYQTGCAIFTVGVDKSWRIVRTDHLCERNKEFITSSYPVVTEGFVHWKGTRAIPVVSLNLETEIISEAHSPLGGKVALKERRTRRYFLSTGRYLSLFFACGNLEWKLFVMNNTGTRIGEWKKFPNICLKGKMERLGINFKHNVVVEPWGWLKYPEVLAFNVGRDIFFYNCITCEVLSVEIFTVNNFFVLSRLTKNSLVWLAGS